MDSYQRIHFRLPDLRSGKPARIFHEDANLLVRQQQADLVYIDTPYNSRQYGDSYHVLESIARWDCPTVSGVAMKPVDRHATKSLYSTSEAPTAFDDLVSNIHARYVLVSYSNMENKGNPRSNAKISAEEIESILRKRGDVSIYSEPFQPFSAGKSHITDHREKLYLLKVRK